MTDLYQLNMMNGYFVSGISDRVAVFDLFFRSHTLINSAIAAGLAQAIEYIENLKFTKDDIEYLKSLNSFDDGFIQYLENFRFSGDIWSVEEGEVAFSGEPIMVVKAKIIEAQLLETTLLNIINHQTLIATKASRIVQAAGQAKVIEFGLRRAQGPDAGIFGTRAAMIGGCNGTSNVMGAKMFNVDVYGTHAHSWILSFDNELEAFQNFAKIYPDNCTLLVDTYHTLYSGVPNAIKVFTELRQKGHKPVGIRLDSGDLAYLSREARKMLDNAGFEDAIIFASNDIDEYLIEQLKLQDAKIDVYGVGTKLITSSDLPSLGGVYKLAGIEDGKGKIKPVIKFSESASKTTDPGHKELYRIYDNHIGMAFADIITLREEKLKKPLHLTHPTERWRKAELKDYIARKLLVPIFKGGKCVYKIPPLEQTIEFSRREKLKFRDECKRITGSQIYKVNLSDKLFNLKQKLLALHPNQTPTG